MHVSGDICYEFRMPDTLSQTARSERMRLIKATNSSAEIEVRRLIHSMGYRYSLHNAKLAGRPDIVLWRHRKIIFVHGCFWHRHGAKSCKLARLPKSRLDFWLPKLEANRLRDRRNIRKLRADGWKILVVWECQLSDKERIGNKLLKFLEGRSASG